ncbi:hypothetical protein Q8F55_001586 [Vanrija albida]|uniref:F-box domain-containing protein n=1 Tax=Vanrija albida TaxID=181172 RepID=A0ABR3QGL0_9TREE
MATTQEGPRLPLELQDIIISLALDGCDPSARFDLAVSLRSVSKAANALASAQLYAHVAVVASQAPVFGPQPKLVPPANTGRRVYYAVVPGTYGLRLEVLAPSGRRIPGLDWNGGAVARQLCVERLSKHCTAVDEVKLTSWDLANSPSERAELFKAIGNATTYRRHSDGPSLSIKPTAKMTTFVGFVDIPNEYVWDGNGIAEGMEHRSKHRYLNEIRASCDVLCFEPLPATIRTAVFNINMREDDTVPTAGWLFACKGLTEVVFVIRETVPVDLDDPLAVLIRGGRYQHWLGLLHYLVIAVAKAHHVRKVTFVGLEKLDNEWFGEDIDEIPTPVAQGARFELIESAIVDEIKDDYERQRNPSVTDDDDEDGGEGGDGYDEDGDQDGDEGDDRDNDDGEAENSDPPEHPPEIAILSFEQFRRANPPAFYELCTEPCTFSTET